jgi:hypothetical protein
MQLATLILYNYRVIMAAPQHRQVTALSFRELTPQLEAIARRVTWWKTPVEALANTNDFLCRVMTFGLWRDVTYVAEMFGDDAMRQALNQAPAGVFDPPSWHYWHYRLGYDQVPGLPRREFR